MKIVITNQQGRIGKSSIAGNAFLPFMPEGTQFFSIESLNDGAEQFGVELTKHRGGDTLDILSNVMTADHVLLDVGASNFEPFFLGLSEFSGVDDFDLFVVPTVPGKRESLETMKTVAKLRAFGVPADRIRIVFNMVVLKDLSETLEEGVKRSFAEILDFAKSEKSCVADPKVALPKSNLFDHLSRSQQTLAEALADKTDYAAEMRATIDDPEEHQRVRGAFAAMRLSKQIAADCHALFKRVTAGIQ
ncbi:TPA: hypothetical protein ACRMZW_004308 [Pseudomonas aeruginosa]